MNFQKFVKANKMIKIKKINIEGLRGIRKAFNLQLDSKSTLIYGDNGSGKSSIADSIEWFYYDRVEHLSTEEIGRKGIEALRNIHLENDEDAFAELFFTDNKLNSRKRLFIKNSKLLNDYSNTTKDFSEYIDLSLKENLILRYKDLIKFIVLTKSKKLEEISEIIGFSEVTKIKSVLKKAVNDLKKELKLKDYDSQINRKQAIIIEQLGQNITNDEQYLNAVRELIKPLKLPVEIKNDNSIGTVLASIKQPKDEGELRLQVSYEKVISALKSLKDSVRSIRSSYETTYQKYLIISKDTDKFKKISLEKLLSEGLSILEKRIYENDKCPLCLQEKKRGILIDELTKRIEELSAFKEEKEEFEEEKTSTQKLVQKELSEIEAVQKEPCILHEELSEIKKEIAQLKRAFSDAIDELKKISLQEFKEIANPVDFLNFEASKIEEMVPALEDKKNRLVEKRKDDIRFTITSKLIIVQQAYKDIKALKRESVLLANQQHSMELIYGEFAKKQKDGLSSFLTAISKDINDFYLYMNNSEKVDSIELMSIGEEEEFVGITFQLKFHGEIISPPDKYLSESHLNCLGICLFLSSVKAFNKVNRFFILDDVISSFDKHHRIRFAHLLQEKFSDYQIFLFTHEKDWFEYVANMVKSQNWLIKKVVWNYENGSYIEPALYELKDKIEHKFKMSDSSELGNSIRIYLERLLKGICFNFEVKVKFLYNEDNEKRMFNELISALQSTLKQRKCELKDEAVFSRLLGSAFLGNVTSHDSSFSEDIADLKAFYGDVLELERLFSCDECGKFISVLFFDNVENRIRCSCGKRCFNWKI